ncbi:hypothetical protein DENSPDRAFT_806964 [Dentipellis sp. KUC8613]|nr:hypothetical protein DENSPDRAFT_806964 [Dentipellis sp. KUC8613]
MSSADDEPNDSENIASQNAKKRRVQRACDVCRRKKIRCDGGQMPGNKCSNCIAYNFECTYVEAAKKRGPPKGYVESLETRLEKMEALLQRLCPDADFSQELGMQLDREGWARDRPNDRGPLSSVMSPGGSATRTCSPPRLASPAPGGSGTTSSPSNEVEELEPSDDEYAQTQLLQERMRQLHINPMHNRFFGKSSGVRLVQTAMDLKSEYSGVDVKTDARDVPRRPEFWSLHPWECKVVHGEKKHYTFPEPDLLDALIKLFFKHINVLIPLLHRPTFDKAVAEGLHNRDENFAGVLLLVCACASRYSDDKRVILEGTDSWHSAGWTWFSQIQMVRKALLSAPCLYDLQMYSLSVLYLQGCSAPQACWTMVGIGIRVAQDVGAHRRKVYNATLTIEDELWKRAFWVLVILDRLMSAALGRPCAIQEEDFDIDFPVECDDEYWTHPDPELAFKQPPGKETYMSYFICFLKLNQILAFALRTIYSINKSKILLGFVGQQWEQHIVAELDSALNKWIDSVPDHLRWDPTREHETYFLQSASLYCTYYHLQILIHRPFIPSPRKPSPLSFPSLAICTNAARSCSHVVDVQRRRSPGTPFAHFQLPVFTSAVVLLLSIWGVKRSGVSIDPVKEMEDVHKCMRVLKDAETKFHAAGRLWDVLYELASVGDLPLPQPSPASSVKRERDSDSISSTSSPAASATAETGPRNIAGSRRVSKDFASRTNSLSAPPPPPPIPSALHTTSPTTATPAGSGYPYTNLPMHSDELGRMPIYPNVASTYASTSMSTPGTHSHTMTSPTASTSAADNTAASNNWYMSSATGAPGTNAGMDIAMNMDNLAGIFPVDQLVSETIFPQGLDFSMGAQYVMNASGPGGGYSFPGAPPPPQRQPYDMPSQAQRAGGVAGMSSASGGAPPGVQSWPVQTPTGYQMNEWDEYMMNFSGVPQPPPQQPPHPSGGH